MSGAFCRNYIQTTNRVHLKLGGFTFDTFSRVEIARDLQDISGTFAMECVDEARLRQALPVWLGASTISQQSLDSGLACEIRIDGDPVLIGWVETLELDWDADKIGARITGRDRTGDLVECAAVPDGPAEFRNVDLLYVAKAIAAPFGIPVRADVDIGAPFDRLASAPHETAMSLLEKATRQRSVLLTSDDVGGLLLTRGGKTRAPAPLVTGDNMEKLSFKRDFTHRFSRYIIKGQSGRHRGGSAALDHTVVPEDGAEGAPDAMGEASTEEALGTLMTGEARDPEMKRYRPIVRVVRTQSGMSSVQEQAEWMLRVARGQSENLRATVLDWRDGPDRKLWLPNQLTLVNDRYSGLNKDMLIAGVQYRFDQNGLSSEVRLAGPTAFDRINEASRRRHRYRDQSQSLDASVPSIKAH